MPMANIRNVTAWVVVKRYARLYTILRERQNRSDEKTKTKQNKKKNQTDSTIEVDEEEEVEVAEENENLVEQVSNCNFLYVRAFHSHSAI